MKNELYIIIPAYNEQENIRSLIHDWYPVVERIPGARLVIINDGSTDQTYETLCDLAKSRPGFMVIDKPNGGHGDTLLFGYRYAIEQGAEWIFQTDSDGQTKASEFQAFWNDRNRFDAVLGCRKKRGDGLGRKLIEDVLCIIVRVFFGVRVPDANCPFRLMRAEKVSQYISNLPEHYFLPNVMLTVFFAKNDRVSFREITFESRKNGTNSINFKRITAIGMKSLRDFYQFRKKMK